MVHGSRKESVDDCETIWLIFMLLREKDDEGTVDKKETCIECDKYDVSSREKHAD